MDFISSELQIGALALLLGILIGILGYRFLGRSTRVSEKVSVELDAAKAELGEYRASVNEHFQKTSELVNDLTQNYVKIYQHLADGAQRLGDSKTFDNLLEQQQGKIAIAVEEPADSEAVAADESIVATEVTETAPEEPVDEHAEPFAETKPAAAPAEKSEKIEPPVKAESAAQDSESEAVSDDSDAEKARGASAKPGESAETPETVLNVDALDEAIEKADRDDQPKVAAAAKASDEKPESRPTTH